ncbi:FAD-dependent oxidoreductase [Alisedimentitalea sp. MJ-SS2]|uniref:NAD(P)/FAD-dependent oxidoreductase n=1 Tax=Aliisedimentitalea sp. MJ-SS2 TaxID=3049795 RepID=UPI00290B1F46|nr:FAD-dependent oxidoreductase [Alisedimentitalea sp. MJ-SS2]MDU8928058.1 FAD-dependent oxidoreductase [Alisedimentitalea sp. MJ-SS2]
MRRLYPDYAYSDQRIAGCFWAETVPDTVLQRPAPGGDLVVDVAIIGGGFTGLSAALHLAQSGARVAVLEARFPGWGASGRNGGFCCLGGSKARDGAIDKALGREARLEWMRAEKAAVDLVARLIETHGIEASVHSKGETMLAHTRAAARFEGYAEQCRENFGVEPELIDKSDLADHGLGGAFHGAMTIPIGFGLDPRQYLAGLLQAAETAGATVFGNSPVLNMTRDGGQWRLTTADGRLRADQVIVATNGYSSEDVPEWMAARYIPTQSSVIVTRPLTQDEQEAQGWTSDQMAYDTRRLLHYFRKMPNGRFLFGMRGGLRSSPTAEATNRRLIRRDFDTMFPEWRHVEATHYWNGMVCLAANLTPFAGPVPDMPGVFAGFAYHGNGVAMGSYTGALLADHLSGDGSDRPIPTIMQKPAGRFPLGRFRRALMFPAYALYGLLDRFG